MKTIGGGGGSGGGEGEEGRERGGEREREGERERREKRKREGEREMRLFSKLANPSNVISQHTNMEKQSMANTIHLIVFNCVVLNLIGLYCIVLYYITLPSIDCIIQELYSIVMYCF